MKKGLTNKKRCAIIYKSLASVWEHSSVGRASALQAGGHRFEPYCSHHIGPVAQLVRALACHARGRGFEPHPSRHFCYSTICGFSSFGRARPCQGRGGGFEPRNPLQKNPSLRTWIFFIQVADLV